ncbi:hypothetical protein AAFF_G00057840 [Aldrovandia affinis]|uniref:Uncharacterized protein n=1 Tax=Aldrovandia affinis TaxID=143900 RepID=A0AAD7WE36_9TELE|nr:hypothetical protein AAFF_G00057840 [Aldrovandia affinis]
MRGWGRFQMGWYGQQGELHRRAGFCQGGNGEESEEQIEQNEERTEGKKNQTDTHQDSAVSEPERGVQGQGFPDGPSARKPSCSSIAAPQQGLQYSK